MKLLPSLRNQRRRGMAVVVVLALLTVILIYVMANLHALTSLHQELKLTERRQLKRLNAVNAANAAALTIRSAATNSPPP